MKFKLSSGEVEHTPEEVAHALEALAHEQKSKTRQHGNMCSLWEQAKPQKSMHAECANCGISELLHAMAGKHPNHTSPAHN